MCAWSESISSQPALRGAAGELVSIRIAIESRLLEPLLEALAEVSFPVNPEIFHQAVVVCVNEDGRRESKPATLVRFPAYADTIPEVRSRLERHGVDPDSVQIRGMLSELEEGPKRSDVPWLVWGGPGANGSIH